MQMINIRTVFSVSAVLLLTAAQLIPKWTPQASGVTARLRGISAVSDKVAWASGSRSTVLRTVDGGASWQQVRITDETLDFRDIDAIEGNIVYVLSIGNGAASRVYKTVDSGKTWSEQFRASDAKVFLDAMSFWDAAHGVVIGDSVDSVPYILTTVDGGKIWSRVPADMLPGALENEGAFAASGTNIALYGDRHAWIGTGAASRARVFYTEDRGRTWKVADTPLAAGKSAGVFSVAFRDAMHGVIVGGDYSKENEAVDNLAVTRDGGRTWQLARGLSGFRSVVAYVPGSNAMIAVGPSGTDYSADDGSTWRAAEGPGFDTMSFAPRRSVAWGSGARGAIGRLSFTN
jgi:photosystem II stability/assembly factor-like uncharacterized protein